MTKTFFLASSSGGKKSEFIEFTEFIKYLSQYGLIRSESLSSDIFISINHNKKFLKKFIKANVVKKPRILLRLEPYCVYPKQYSTEIETLYDLIITPGSINDFKRGENFVGFPHAVNPNPLQPSSILNHIELEGINNLLEININNWKQREILCSMVVANKISPVRTSNYSLRRTIATENKNNFLHIYGQFWRSSFRVKILYRFKVLVFNLKSNTEISMKEIYGKLFTSFHWTKGDVINKYDIMKNSKFSLVIENSNDYVSEKLFDAILCESVPIYFGPDLPSVGLPQNIAIRLESLKNFSAITLESIDDESIRNYLEAGKEFLHSSNYCKNWHHSSVYRKIAHLISNFVNP